MKWILVILSFFTLNYASAQIPVDDIWPVLKKIDRRYIEFLNNDKWIFAGAVQGDCKNGEGIYLGIQEIKVVNNKDYRVCYRIACKIWKGHFTDDGKYFTGSRYYVETEVNQKKEKADYFPEQELDLSAPEQNATWPDYVGHFKLATLASRDYIKFYRPDGELRDVYRERKHGYLQYSGVYTYGLGAYLRIDYPAEKIEKNFRGYLDRFNYRVLGRLEYNNGDIYEGTFTKGVYNGFGRLLSTTGIQEGIWEKGKLVKSVKVYIPDTTTLKNAIINNNRFPSNTMMIYTPPMHFDEGSNYQLEGVFANAATGDTSMNSGLGLFYKDNNSFYFGNMKNRRPDGLAYVLINEDSYNQDYYESAADEYFYGNFEHGWFRSGTTAWIERSKEDGNYGDINDKLIGPFVGTPGEDEAREGIMASEGHFGLINPDVEKALVLLNRSAALGNAEANYRLGYLYNVGHGVTEDETKAAKYYQIAADKGYVKAMTKVAWYYLTGIGISKDSLQARSWYSKAAIAGDLDAKKELLKLNYPLMSNMADQMMEMDAASLDFYSLVEHDLEIKLAAKSANQQLIYRQSPYVTDNWLNDLHTNQPTTRFKIVVYYNHPVYKFSISMFHVEKITEGDTTKTHTLSMNSSVDGSYSTFYKANVMTFTASPIDSKKERDSYQFALGRDLADFRASFAGTKIAWAILVEN